MTEEIKENNIPNNVLQALGDLTNGAINYYTLPKTTLEEQKIILNYITNLQNENEKLKENLLNEQKEYEGLHKVLNQKEEQFEKENYDNIVEIHRLKSRNENLQKENQNLEDQLDFIDEQNKYIDKLEKMIKDYKQKNENLQNENEQLRAELNTLKMSEEQWLDKTLDGDE